MINMKTRKTSFLAATGKEILVYKLSLSHVHKTQKGRRISFIQAECAFCSTSGTVFTTDTHLSLF